MKAAVVFVVLVAGAMSMPPQEAADVDELTSAFRLAVKDHEPLLVGSIISGYIEQLKKLISDAGLDPIYINSVEYSYSILDIVELLVVLQDICLEGLSNIVSQQISFNIISLTLNLNIYIEEIYFSAAAAKIGAVLGEDFYGLDARGSVAIEKPRISGSSRVRIFPSISVYDTELEFHLERISSHLRIQVFNDDYSKAANTILDTCVPAILAYNRELINRLLSEIVTSIANTIL